MPVIEIRRIAEGFEVVVTPPHPDHPCQTFDTHKRAIGYAGGIRMVAGWNRADKTQEAAHGDSR